MTTSAIEAAHQAMTAGAAVHALPPRAYDYGALEPYIDARTMMLHHYQHHAAYVAQLNAALERLPDLRGRSIAWLLCNVEEIPQSIRAAVRNNAGGHFNHSFFWRSMTPHIALHDQPIGDLATAIVREFGSFSDFQRQFEGAGEAHFGSGWVWLASTESGVLKILSTPAHDNPLLDNLLPILVNDLWEHAYYLKHQNRRGEYLKQWWPVANWTEAERRYQEPTGAAKEKWESDGGTIAMTSQH